MNLEDKINIELDLMPVMSSTPSVKTFQTVYGSYGSVTEHTDVVIMKGSPGMVNELDCRSLYLNPGQVMSFINTDQARWKINLPYKEIEMETNQTITFFYDGSEYFKI